jgi:hypothetical protein
VIEKVGPKQKAICPSSVKNYPVPETEYNNALSQKMVDPFGEIA